MSCLRNWRVYWQTEQRGQAEEPAPLVRRRRWRLRRQRRPSLGCWRGCYFLVAAALDDNGSDIIGCFGGVRERAHFFFCLVHEHGVRVRPAIAVARQRIGPSSARVLFQRRRETDHDATI